MINVDLNKGALGRYVYLCYSTEPEEAPITNIQVVAGTLPAFNIQNGYTKIDKEKQTLGAIPGRAVYAYVCRQSTRASLRKRTR